MHNRILKLIKAERIKKGFSQHYISNVLQIEQSQYNRIENGKSRMTASQLICIFQILDLRFEILSSISIKAVQEGYQLGQLEIEGMDLQKRISKLEVLIQEIIQRGQEGQYREIA